MLQHALLAMPFTLRPRILQFHGWNAAAAELDNVMDPFECEEHDLAAEAREIQREEKQVERFVARLLNLLDDQSIAHGHQQLKQRRNDRFESVSIHDSSPTAAGRGSRRTVEIPLADWLL